MLITNHLRQFVSLDPAFLSILSLSTFRTQLFKTLQTSIVILQTAESFCLDYA